MSRIGSSCNDMGGYNSYAQYMTREEFDRWKVDQKTGARCLSGYEEAHLLFSGYKSERCYLGCVVKTHLDTEETFRARARLVVEAQEMRSLLDEVAASGGVLAEKAKAILSRIDTPRPFSGETYRADEMYIQHHMRRDGLK